VLSPRRLIANEIKTRLAVPGFGITAHSFYNDKLLEPEEAQVAMSPGPCEYDSLPEQILAFGQGWFQRKTVARLNLDASIIRFYIWMPTDEYT